MLEKLFRKDLQITYFIESWATLIFIVGAVIYMQFFRFYIEKKNE